MELAQYAQCVAQPITEDNPIGERLVDDPLFDFVEEQMMKVGSLSHGSVQWDEVEHSTVKLLCEKTKDIKLLAILLQCLHNDMTPTRWIASFDVMARFISRYWLICYPAPGERGNLPRRKFFSQMLQRFLLASERVDYSQFRDFHHHDMKSVIDCWKSAIARAQLGNDLVSQLVRKVEVGLSGPLLLNKGVEQVEDEVPRLPIYSMPNVNARDSYDKNSKETLLKVADFLSDQDLSTPISIRLRRFAVWGGISSAPDHNSQGNTLLRGMQSDRVRDYGEQIAHSDLVLWRKVEQSLTMAPFWFEGQWMSYRIAEKLGKTLWCEAILQECSSFLDRIPKLYDLKFKGGEPFITAEVRDWLSQSRGTNASVVVGDWAEKRAEILSLAKEGGLAVALNHLNQGLDNAVELRECAYWRLLIADVLNANQLEAMAKQQYQILHTQISTLNVFDWEPSFIERLKRHVSEV